MSEPGPTRLDRVDFRATSDPGLQEAADHTGGATLLGYGELYSLWERQQWAVADLDFERDRRDWEGFDPEERFQRMAGLSSFFIGEQRVAAELGPIMRAVPDEDMRIFLGTQIADEARHVAFFDRFYREVGVVEAEDIAGRLQATAVHTNDAFARLFDEMLAERVARLCVAPQDSGALVEAITIYHMVIEGMLALTGQHLIIDYNERMGTLPGFVAGFTNVARDEHRHVAFGARFLRDMTRRDPSHSDRIRAILAEVAPIADQVLKPRWAEDSGLADDEALPGGVSINDGRAFAAVALSRRLRAIGLDLAA